MAILGTDGNPVGLLLLDMVSGDVAQFDLLVSSGPGRSLRCTQSLYLLVQGRLAPSGPLVDLAVVGLPVTASPPGTLVEVGLVLTLNIPDDVGQAREALVLDAVDGVAAAAWGV